MAVKWATVKAGDVLWDYHSERAGNTKMRRWGNWPVRIVEIDHEAGSAVVVWNSFNRPEKWSRRRVERLRRTKGKEQGR